MFGFLKKKLKGAIASFSKKLAEEAETKEEIVEEIVEEKVEKEEKDEPLKEEVEKEVVPEEKVEKKEVKEDHVVEKIKEEAPEVKDEEILKEELKEAEELKKVEPKTEEGKIEELQEEVTELEDIEKERHVAKEVAEVKEEPKKGGFFKRLFGKKEEPPKEVEVKEKLPEKKLEVIKEEPKGFFKKITHRIITKKISGKQFDELFWDLEVILLENNVAVEVIEKLKEDLKKKLVDVAIKRTALQETVIHSLENSIRGLFSVKGFDLVEKSKSKKPYVICFIGVNGSGKTTTIAKIAHMFQEQGVSCVLAAADTFRAAAIDQLQEHADKLGIKLIKHDYGSDAAAVAFDAVKHAEAKGKDVVLIDTAGRLHSNVNLMDELKKIIRVAKPDLKIFIGESITGNDCVEQAKKFNEAVGIDGIILSKADIDEKGGAAISVSYVTQKPILYLGTGQGYNDLEVFNADELLKSLGL